MMSSKLNFQRTLLVSSLFLSLSLFLTGCSQKQAMVAPPPTAIEVQQLAAGTISNYSEYVGSLISRSSVSLQSQVPGQITAIYVKAGDQVRKGDPLLLVDPSQQQAAVASSSAAAQSQQASIAQAQESLRVLREQRTALQSAVDLSQSQYDRYEKLASLNSVSKQEVEQYRNALNQAQANLAANDAQISAQKAAIVTAQRGYQQAQALTQQQRVQLRYHRITAPFSGTVGDIPVKLGNYIQPLTQLLSVTQNNQLELNLRVPAERALELKPGLPVEIVTEDGQLLAQSKLSFISPKVDEQAQTILTKAIFENPKGLLKADQLVNARLIWEKKPGIQIPTQSVVHMGGRDFVYVMESGKTPDQFIARQLPVLLGNIEGAFYVVQSGLKAGDHLIVSGIQKLADGAPVTPPQK